MFKNILGQAADKAAAGLAAAKTTVAEAADRTVAGVSVAHASVTQTAESAKASVASVYEATSSRASDAFNTHWPTIQELIVKGLIGIAEDRFNDPAAMRAVFETVHAAMPMPLRVAIRQELFVTFCFSQQQALGEQLASYKSRSLLPSGPPPVLTVEHDDANRRATLDAEVSAAGG